MDRKILVLEDEVIVAMDIAAELGDAGWSVVGPAGTVDLARQLASSESPDVAVLDVNVNGKTSFELAMQLQSDGVKVIFLTGYSAASLPEVLSHWPVLSKPVNMSELIAALD